MTENTVKKRWIGLFVENEIGVLARVSGLLAGKSYNLDELTVGVTEDESISRMTITLTSDDKTFEQVKKQLNRSVEVIKVIDYTDISIHRKELMYVKIKGMNPTEKEEAFRIAQVFAGVKVSDCDKTAVLLECVQTGKRNDDLIALLKSIYGNRIEVVRGGSVAIEAISKSDS